MREQNISGYMRANRTAVSSDTEVVQPMIHIA